LIKFSRQNNKYGCFSNFYSCSVEYEGIVYPNSECAWQSLKTFDIEVRKKFATYTAAGAKKMGRRVSLRSDWEEVKYNLMVNVCYAKFSQNEDLKEILLSTGDEILVENTTGWHDNIWGNCECEKCQEIEGKNLLGKALMEVRNKLVDSMKKNEKTGSQILDIFELLKTCFFLSICAEGIGVSYHELICVSSEKELRQELYNTFKGSDGEVILKYSIEELMKGKYYMQGNRMGSGKTRNEVLVIHDSNINVLFNKLDQVAAKDKNGNKIYLSDYIKKAKNYNQINQVIEVYNDYWENYW